MPKAFPGCRWISSAYSHCTSICVNELSAGRVGNEFEDGPAVEEGNGSRKDGTEGRFEGACALIARNGRILAAIR